MTLHPIDRPHRHWPDENLEKYMVFCLLDRSMPYANVCRVFNGLDLAGLTTRKGILELGIGAFEELTYQLRMFGHRFPNQTANHLILFAKNPIDLRNATREEIDSIKGIGPKLASMFLRNTRNEPFAVLDVHLKRWLRERGHKFKTYAEGEKAFLKEAKKHRMDPYELDIKIWEERRRKGSGNNAN